VTQADSRLVAGLRGGRIPPAVKTVYTAFMAVLIPYYWVTYGPVNFLWFCDVALLVTLVALWLENPFLASMQATAILLPQMLWVADFLARLIAGASIIGLADYMFDPKIPWYVRGLSSFHGWLPLLLAWMVWRLGYDRRAWIAQIVVAWVLLMVCYHYTPLPPPPPEDPNAAVNVNWVFGFGKEEAQTWMDPRLYLALLMAFFPVCIYWPTHLALGRLVPDWRAIAVRQPSSA